MQRSNVTFEVDSQLVCTPYKTYIDQGLLIGSGPIEAAHRSVMQQRMKLFDEKWSSETLRQLPIYVAMSDVKFGLV